MIIDIAFVLAMMLAVFQGYREGFVVAIFSMVAFIVGLAAALKWSAVAATYLQQHVASANKWLPLISFFIVFIVVVILVGVGAKLIRNAFRIAMLGWLDRIAGVALYIIVYTIILSIILFYAEKMLLISPDVASTSYIYRFIQPWGPKIINGLGDIIPFFKDLFLQLQSFFESAVEKPV